MRVTQIRKLEELQSHEESWNQLTAEMGERSLPVSYGWLVEWWKSFGSGQELHVSLIFDNERLVCIAPMQKITRRKYGLSYSAIELISNGHVPFSKFIVSPSLSHEQLDSICQLLLVELSADVLNIKKISVDDPVLPLIAKSLPNFQFKSGRVASLITPVVTINQQWDEFFAERPRKFRSNMRSKLKKFSQKNEYTIERRQLTSASDVEVSEMIDISSNSWKTSIGNDLGSNLAGRNFVLGIIQKFGPKNQAYLWIMKKSGTPVAYELHFIDQGTVYPLRADFDERYRKDSPGSILEYHALKSLFDEGVYKEYYSCGDNYAYLRNWTDNIHEYINMEIYTKSIKGRLLYFLEWVLKPKIKPLYSLYRKSLKKAPKNLKETKKK